MQQIEFIMTYLTLLSILKMAKVSSTYLWYMQGLVFESKPRDSCK